MAVLLQLAVTSATQEQFNELDLSVGEAMGRAGGPPPGLMAHVVYPDGDGFVVSGVWRTESEAERYVDDVLRPIVAGLGMTASASTVRPVWSFARP